MRFVFIVQGEGRGHMTQAISLSKILQHHGDELCEVIIGKSPSRRIPKFFYDKIGASVTTIESPNFIKDRNQKSVMRFRTIIYSIWNSKVYKKSIQQIADIITSVRPDVIINFYDFLGGIYNFFHKPSAKFICIAHQYLMSHPEFTFPPGQKLDRLSILMANRITRLGADKVLALSFQHFDDFKNKKLFIIPPLLRGEVIKSHVTKSNHLLVYLVNPGYGKEIENFHKIHPSIPIQCFWDDERQPAELIIDENLSFHQIDDDLFLEKMSSCKGLATTAGFESVCEAMYMSKPVLMVPVKGHFEQACNAMDAIKAGAGTSCNQFDLSQLIEYLPEHEQISKEYTDWINGSNDKILSHLM